MKLHLLALTLLAPLALQGAQQNASATATPARTDANAAAAAPAVPVDGNGNPIATHAEADTKSGAAAPSNSSAATYLPAPKEDARFNEELLKKIDVLKKQIQAEIKGMDAETIRNGQSNFVHRLFMQRFYTGFPKGWTLLHIANIINHEGNQPLSEQDKDLARAAQKLMIDTLGKFMMHSLFKSEGDISGIISNVPIFTLGQLLRSHIQNRPDPYHADMPRYEGKLKQLTVMWDARHRVPVMPILREANFPEDLIGFALGFVDPEPPALSIADLISYRPFYEQDLKENVARLELSDNRLTTLDDLGLICEPRNPWPERTTEIRLNGNRLTSLPEALPANFVHCTKLYLSGNRLTEIDTARLPLGLKYLDLSNNRIGSLSVSALKAYAELNNAVAKTTFVLNLAGNPLLKDPQELEKIRELQKTLYIKTGLPASEPQKGTE